MELYDSLEAGRWATLRVTMKVVSSRFDCSCCADYIMKVMALALLACARSITQPIPLGCLCGLFCLQLVPGRLIAAPQSATAAISSAADDDRGQTAASTFSEADIRSALRRLESDEVAVRDAAEVELISMGAKILPRLPDITPRTSGELKGRLQRIRQALQKETIEDFFQPSLVSVQGELELGEVLKQLQQQSGNRMELQGAAGVYSGKVTLDATEAPFWTVTSQVMKQAKLRINAFGSTDGSLVLSPGRYESAVEPYVSGPFYVEAVSVQTRKVFNSQLDGQLDFSFQLAWEPRLKPVFMQIPMSSVMAITADGQELKATTPLATLEIPLNLGGSSSQVDLQLEKPTRSAQKISKLSGELVIAVPGELHQYVFKRFGNGARQTEKYGDVTVTLEGARRNGAVYEIRVLASFGDARGALESFRGWILSNQAYLLDANDKRLENVGLQTYAVTPDSVGIAFLFQINNDPDSYRLVYESPAAITKQTLAYELNDIELP
jgi:hypothetical protein